MITDIQNSETLSCSFHIDKKDNYKSIFIKSINFLDNPNSIDEKSNYFAFLELTESPYNFLRDDNYVENNRSVIWLHIVRIPVKKYDNVTQLINEINISFGKAMLNALINSYFTNNTITFKDNNDENIYEFYSYTIINNYEYVIYEYFTISFPINIAYMHFKYNGMLTEHYTTGYTLRKSVFDTLNKESYIMIHQTEESFLLSVDTVENNINKLFIKILFQKNNNSLCDVSCSDNNIKNIISESLKNKKIYLILVDNDIENTLTLTFIMVNSDNKQYLFQIRVYPRYIIDNIEISINVTEIKSGIMYTNILKCDDNILREYEDDYSVLFDTVYSKTACEYFAEYGFRLINKYDIINKTITFGRMIIPVNIVSDITTNNKSKNDINNENTCISNASQLYVNNDDKIISIYNNNELYDWNSNKNKDYYSSFNFSTFNAFHYLSVPQYNIIFNYKNIYSNEYNTPYKIFSGNKYVRYLYNSDVVYNISTTKTIDTHNLIFQSDNIPVINPISLNSKPNKLYVNHTYSSNIDEYINNNNSNDNMIEKTYNENNNEIEINRLFKLSNEGINLYVTSNRTEFIANNYNSTITYNYV